MKILHTAAEYFPFIKVGGLSDMLSSLSLCQAENSEVSIALPLLNKFRNGLDFTGKEYPCISENAPGYSDVSRILKSSRFLEARHKNLKIYFFECERFSGFQHIYGNSDEHFNFAMFSYACYFLGVTLKADVVHSHDWHTALTVVLNAMSPDGRPTCFTIHNLAYQGTHPFWMTGFLRMDPFLLDTEVLAHLDKVNYMKGALETADEIITVSPGYKDEILQEPAGNFLSWLLNKRSDSLTGILNGVDVTEWNPETDNKIHFNYNKKTHKTGKEGNKSSLYKESNLNISVDRPLIGLIGRITYQKGFETFLSSFYQRPDLPFYYFFLGSGEPKLEDELLRLSNQQNSRLLFYKGFDETLAHKIEAASDFFLMPSLFEPCGLNQFYSHIYGSIPIVSRVGGLKDSVYESDNVEFTTGILFEPGLDHSLNFALSRAATLYSDKPKFEKVRENIMSIDWSWAKSMGQYRKIYERAIRKRNI